MPFPGRSRLAAVSVKTVAAAARIAICGAALWLAFSQVSIHDSVTLRDGGPPLRGTVIERNGRAAGDPSARTDLEIRLVDGSQRSIGFEDVAADADGTPRISFGLSSIWLRSDKALLLAAVGCFLLVPVLQGVRYQWILRSQQIRMGLWDSVKLAFAGNFLNFAAPLGSTAGDVFKAYYASLHTDRKTEAATSVFIDRAIGLGTLLLSVAVIAAFAPTGSRLGALRGYLLGLTAIPLLCGLLYVSPFVRRSRLAGRIVQRLPKADQLRRIDASARALLARKGLLAVSIALTVVLQVLAAATFVCLATAIGLAVRDAHLMDIYAYFSAGEVVKAIPGPPQGLGTAELAYAYFFAGLGSASQIVCAALGVRLVNLLCALPGLAVVVTGAYRPRSAGCGDADRPAGAASRLPVAAAVSAR